MSHLHSAEPRVVAVIPARGGSKGVPHKNLRPVGGIPLVVRAINAARRTPEIDEVYVSTDDAEITALATQAGALVIERPAEISGDQASSEAALLHALGELDGGGRPADVLVFIQATSPFIRPEQMGDAVRRVLDGDEDVVFSVVGNDHFLWRLGSDGAYGVNHDKSVRLRRQDREPEYRETGAFYVMDAAGFVAAGHRFFGRVGLEIVDENDSLEIDTLEQMDLANVIAATRDASGPDGSVGEIEALVTDFDGVHTDDTVHVDQHGVETVVVSRSDGMGVRLLRESGLPVAIISTETNPVVSARAAKLGVEVVQSVTDKAAAVQQWARRIGVDLSRVAFIGNDVNDLSAFSQVGWPIAVADAHPRVLAAARIHLSRRGGDGAVREASELILNNRKVS